MPSRKGVKILGVCGKFVEVTKCRLSSCDNYGVTYWSAVRQASNYYNINTVCG